MEGRVGLVQLQHGELGVVPGRHALVAEIAVDLVDPLQPTDHQALEVQLRGHAQVQLQVQGVVVGDEGLGRGTAGDVMHHRRLHFQEAAAVEPFAHRAHDPRALDEHLACLGGDDQVDIALAVALLHIAQAVPLVRQRPQRLDQQAQRGRFYRQLAGAGPGQPAFDGDDVAHVEGLERLVGLAQGVGLQEQLDRARFVHQLGEAGLAHHPLGHQPAGHGHTARRRFQRLGRPLPGIGELGLQVAGVVGAAEIVGESHALGAQGGELGPALGDQVVLVGVRGRGGGFVGWGHDGDRALGGVSPGARIGGTGHLVGEDADAVPGVAALPAAAPYAASTRLEPASRPAFRLASTNSSRSPSSTFWVSLRSMPVRRSLIRLWSST